MEGKTEGHCDGECPYRHASSRDSKTAQRRNFPLFVCILSNFLSLLDSDHSSVWISIPNLKKSLKPITVIVHHNVVHTLSIRKFLGRLFEHTVRIHFPICSPFSVRPKGILTSWQIKPSFSAMANQQSSPTIIAKYVKYFLCCDF